MNKTNVEKTHVPLQSDYYCYCVTVTIAAAGGFKLKGFKDFW